MNVPNHWRRNVAVLSERFPRIWKAVCGARELPDARLITDTPEASIMVDGLHLTSVCNRIAEAEVQASLIPEGSVGATVYGFALGDLPRVLLRRSGLHRLEVCGLNLGLMRLSLTHFDHTDWLSDRRVHLSLGSDYQLPSEPFAAAPACLRLASDDSIPLRDRVILSLSEPHQQRRSERLRVLTAARLAERRALLQRDGDVGSLFNVARGTTAIIAAGGPTLGDRIDWLREHQAGRLVIAVNSALKPLMAAGIVPDAVVVVDAESRIASHFEGLDASRLADVPLVYLPVVVPEVLERWPGPRLAMYIDRPVYRRFAQQVPKAFLFCSGTVLHPAVDLSVKMGASEVILLGADFSYPDGLSHVDGAVEQEVVRPEERACLWVPSADAGRVPTEPHLIGYLRDLELYIQTTSGVRFASGSSRGALIRGAPPMVEAVAA